MSIHVFPGVNVRRQYYWDPNTLTWVAATQPGAPGSATPLTPAIAVSGSVGVTSDVLVAASSDRTGLVLVNLSTNKVSFGVGTAAILYAGITLTPNGVWVMDPFTFTRLAIHAIASGAASVVSVQEFI